MLSKGGEDAPVASAYIDPVDLDKIRRRLSPEMRALVDILRLTGFRVNDILYSREYQWNGKGGVVTLFERKTKKTRSVPMTPELQEAIERYRSMRFITRFPTTLTYFVQGLRDQDKDLHKRHRSTIYRHFENAVYHAGLSGKGYTIHSLRKCYAVDRYNATGSLLAVQADLGHKSLSTTCLYVFGSRAKL